MSQVPKDCGTVHNAQRGGHPAEKLPAVTSECPHLRCRLQGQKTDGRNGLGEHITGFWDRYCYLTVNLVQQVLCNISEFFTYIRLFKY
ncbi:hypothetical protein AB205_0046130 [Aquarana catesbeiana]|uniref:Uncharacterized protein n=1 Tax=Aquarana catesbeiana TaxID=8400 RepID=A0A2G9PBM8_AQUCT|nr:hypothetical protein AB205_0046130 [Aquarana catesbeiana]